MTKQRRVTFNELIELQEQGRDEEAQRLWKENTTPEQREALQKAAKALGERVSEVSRQASLAGAIIGQSLESFGQALGKSLRSIDWTETEEIMKRYRYAKDHPDDADAYLWLAIEHLTPRQISLLWRGGLKDPLRRRRGRPKGSKSAPPDFLEEVQRRFESSNRTLTEVVRDVARERKPVPDNRMADHVKYLAQKCRERGIK